MNGHFGHAHDSLNLFHAEVGDADGARETEMVDALETLSDEWSVSLIFLRYLVSLTDDREETHTVLSLEEEKRSDTVLNE